MVDCPKCGKRGSLYKYWRKYQVQHKTTKGKTIHKNVYEIKSVYLGVCILTADEAKPLIEK